MSDPIILIAIILYSDRLDVRIHTSYSEIWINMQAIYDLWQAEKNRKKLHIKPILFDHPKDTHI
jgi:plasmid maintenance system antidote protein VapI